LNITPGAVLTENTQFLDKTIFAVKSEDYVKNIMKLIGNFYGNTYAYWGHEFSIFLINLFPFLKNSILYNTGHNIATDYMKMTPKKYWVKFILFELFLFNLIKLINVLILKIFSLLIL